MPTRFTSLGVKGALTVAGLTTLATVVITTLTLTTLNATTVNTQTLSGSTINNANSTVVIDSTDIESTVTISGATIRAITAFTGAKLTATPIIASGTAGLVIYGGAKGSHFCLRDTDNAGWSACDALNGTLSCIVATAGLCP